MKSFPIALVLLVVPLAASGQECRIAGTLGIHSFECRDCSFSAHEGGLSSARFGTEPRVLEVNQDASSGDDLEVDDILVAVDGNLITTAAGVEVLTSLRPGQGVAVRVRRDGRERNLRMIAGATEVCPPGAPIALAAPRSKSPRAAQSRVSPPAPDEPPRSGQAARAVMPPYPPGPLDASLGFSFRCIDCGIALADPGQTPRWRFAMRPEVSAVDRDGPAWSAGLRPGDVIVAVDDMPIESEEGGLRMWRIQPGEIVAFTVRRDGATRVIRLRAGEAPSRDRLVLTAPAQQAPRAGGPTRALRYTGSLGDTTIEVRGAPVTVTEDPATGEIIIRSADVEVRLKRNRD